VESVDGRELRNHGGEVLDRVARGQSMIVIRDGAATWTTPSDPSL
jgi:antitoxin (DNA-binding transcriptional repressor) of toxin-antitoxin stability system